MTGTIVTLTAIAMPLAAFGLHDLQAKLERWSYDRHAQD
jgi:hypothetical protein